MTLLDNFETLPNGCLQLPDILELPEMDSLPGLISSGDMIRDPFTEKATSTYSHPVGKGVAPIDTTQKLITHPLDAIQDDSPTDTNISSQVTRSSDHVTE